MLKNLGVNMNKTSFNARKLSSSTNFLMIKKMIYRLSNHERIKTPLEDGIVRGHGSYGYEPVIKVRALTKEELAKNLGINLAEFEQLDSPVFCKKIASKISSPLVSMYCSTKFADGEDKLDPHRY